MHDNGQEHPEGGCRGGVEQGRREEHAGGTDKGGRHAHAETLLEEEGHGEVNAGDKEEANETRQQHPKREQQ